MQTITTLTATGIPPADLWTAGGPCQASRQSPVRKVTLLFMAEL